MSDDRDAFDEIVGNMTDDFEERVPRNPENYTKMSDLELLLHTKNLLRRDLLERGVLLNPTEDEDIDKQARYYGMLQEMTRRGLR